MNLLIFSKDYFFNTLNSSCLNKETIYELQKLKIDVQMIAQNHPSYNYETTLHIEEEAKIVRVQQYPFANDYYNAKCNNQNNYYANNVRAQEGIMLLLKQGNTFDFIVIDNVGYALAAQSYAEVFEMPVIFLKYPNEDLKENLFEVEKWLINKCDYIINGEKIHVNGDSNQKNDQLQSVFNLFKKYMTTSNSENGECI